MDLQDGIGPIGGSDFTPITSELKVSVHGGCRDNWYYMGHARVLEKARGDPIRFEQFADRFSDPVDPSWRIRNSFFGKVSALAGKHGKVRSAVTDY